MKFALLGSPVAHSKSPRMHAAAFASLGLPHSYDAFDVRGDELPAFIDRLRRKEFDGMNVTIPHKQRVLPLADIVAPSAARVGAANTLTRSTDGRITAHNTDVPALARELVRLGGDSPPLRDSALVLGSGGAALAAVDALATTLRVRRIEVRARQFRGRAMSEAFADAVRARWNDETTADLVTTPWMPGGERDREFAWIVQATSLGMPGTAGGEEAAEVITWESVQPDSVALDVVYSTKTPFLLRAEQNSLRAAGGAGMLVEQGAIAFELWLGTPAPRRVMRDAIA